MSTPDDSDERRFYDAYLTTDMAGGPRTPIAAERIVICFGQDNAGRPLELSIPLEESDEPGVVTLYSINNPVFDERRMQFVAETTTKKVATNVVQLSIAYKSVEQLLTDAPSPPQIAPEKVICSFCRKKHPKTGPLVEGAGPDGNGGIFICRTCTELCLDIFDDQPK